MTAELIGIIELILIAVTAIITVGSAIYVGRQANKHFLMQRSTRFIERFNSGDMLRIRPRVDALIASNPAWADELRTLSEDQLDPDRRLLFYDLVVFTNFFQELATAFKHQTIEETYTWDVFGNLILCYWSELRPYILALRASRERPCLYDTFEELAKRMEAIDEQHRST